MANRAVEPLKPISAWGRLRYLFANDVFRLLIGSQPEKDRLTKLVIVSPLGKLDLGDKCRADPLARLRDRRRNPETPSAFALLRQIYKGARLHPELLKLRIQIRQDLVRKTSADSAGEYEPVRAVVPDQQRTKIASASFRQRVAADNEFPTLGDLEFEPGAASSAAFID